MIRTLFLCTMALVIFASCSKEETPILTDDLTLQKYLDINNDLEIDELIACAGGKPDGFLGQAQSPSSVFFLPIEGAFDFHYFESTQVDDPNNLSLYKTKTLEHIPVFNGFLRRFLNTQFEGERMGIVTFRTPGKLHMCNPIRQKNNVKPTEINESLLVLEENGLNPKFIWQDGTIEENAIYFQVISDENNNLISGTYTFEKDFTFYDLDNVVLNVTPTENPTLESGKNYKFTLMGVSLDNWVNLLIEKEFVTP